MFVLGVVIGMCDEFDFFVSFLFFFFCYSEYSERTFGWVSLGLFFIFDCWVVGGYLGIRFLYWEDGYFDEWLLVLWREGVVIFS